MSTIRLCRIFRFEMAHALYEYDGPCRNIHGHSYELQVTIKGEVRQNSGSKAGMLIDFKLMKNIVNEAVIEPFDHALVMNGTERKEKLNRLKDFSEKIIILPIQPSCENLCTHFAERIRDKLPPGISLHHLVLYETANAYAAWYAEDNA